MVCIYCGQKTKVTNSRLQKHKNNTWRRRQCLSCNAIFTSIEQPDYAISLVLRDGASHIMPFDRDRLFLSLYEACRHRPEAVSDAAALTDTVVQKLLANGVTDGTVNRAALRAVAYDTLGNFDHIAQVHYGAFHPQSKTYE